LIAESSLTYAKTQAENTPYTDHFLCLSQIWSSSSWELGGSGPECNDGMSFKLGKIQLTLGLLGFLGWILNFIIKKNKNFKVNSRFLAISFIGLTSFCMMFPYSLPIWKLFSFILAPFQFPWRFNSFFLFFISFYSGYFISLIHFKKVHFIILPSVLLLIAMILISSKPYFRHPWRVTYDEYYMKYVSDEYIYKKIAYAIPEYLPRTVDYGKWMNFRDLDYNLSYSPFIGNSSRISIITNQPYKKEMKSLVDQHIIINTTYFPFWEIKIDGKQFVPTIFDNLGRPILSRLISNSIVTVQYNETPIEKAGNSITVITFLTLIVVILNKKLWKKINSMLQ
jgi:hypothetical protein